MIYGIDLDGVCYDFRVCFNEWLKAATGLKYKDEDLTSYWWHNCVPGLTEEIFFGEFDKFTKADMYRWLPLFSNTREAISILRAASDDLYFITGRPAITQQTTRFVIARDFGYGQGKLHYSGGSDNKVNAIQELGIDVFIEDGPHYALSIVENTDAKVYLMDAPFNKELEHPKITRVFCWDDVLHAEGLINENSNSTVR